MLLCLWRAPVLHVWGLTAALPSFLGAQKVVLFMRLAYQLSADGFLPTPLYYTEICNLESYLFGLGLQGLLAHLGPCFKTPLCFFTPLPESHQPSLLGPFPYTLAVASGLITIRMASIAILDFEDGGWLWQVYERFFLSLPLDFGVGRGIPHSVAGG